MLENYNLTDLKKKELRITLQVSNSQHSCSWCFMDCSPLQRDKKITTTTCTRLHWSSQRTQWRIYQRRGVREWSPRLQYCCGGGSYFVHRKGKGLLISDHITSCNTKITISQPQVFLSHWVGGRVMRRHWETCLVMQHLCYTAVPVCCVTSTSC